jgi:hypothetical protein
MHDAEHVNEFVQRTTCCWALLCRETPHMTNQAACACVCQRMLGWHVRVGRLFLTRALF